MEDLCPVCNKTKCNACTCSDDDKKKKETDVSIQEKLGVPETAHILIE
jgi:hypothetical protein